jgi:hypothetical protein
VRHGHRQQVVVGDLLVTRQRVPGDVGRVGAAVPIDQPQPGRQRGSQHDQGEFALLGIYLGYVYFKNRQTWEKSSAWKNVGIPLRNYFHSGWGFDWIYTRLFVWPYVAINRANRKDLVDKVFTGLGLTTAGANRALSATETGQVRNYVIGLVLGAILCVAVLLFRH